MIIDRSPSLLLFATSLVASFAAAAPFNLNPYTEYPPPRSDIHSGSDPLYVNQKWKDDKRHIDGIASRINGILEGYSRRPNKPSLPSSSSSSSETLMEAQEQMKKWAHFYGSEQGGRRFDPKGRRKASAEQRGSFADEGNDGVRALSVPEDPVHLPWSEQARAVATQTLYAKSRFEEASRNKKVTYGKPGGLSSK